MPSPSGAMAAATAEPVPPLEPPAVTFGFHGFRVVPKSRFVVLTSWANSGVFVLPRRMAPLALSRSTQMASSVGTLSAKGTAP